MLGEIIEAVKQHFKDGFREPISGYWHYVYRSKNDGKVYCDHLTSGQANFIIRLPYGKFTDVTQVLDYLKDIYE